MNPTALLESEFIKKITDSIEVVIEKFGAIRAPLLFYRTNSGEYVSQEFDIPLSIDNKNAIADYMIETTKIASEMAIVTESWLLTNPTSYDGSTSIADHPERISVVSIGYSSPLIGGLIIGKFKEENGEREIANWDCVMVESADSDNVADGRFANVYQKAKEMESNV